MACFFSQFTFHGLMINNSKALYSVHDRPAVREQERRVEVTSANGTDGSGGSGPPETDVRNLSVGQMAARMACTKPEPWSKCLRKLDNCVRALRQGFCEEMRRLCRIGVFTFVNLYWRIYGVFLQTMRLEKYF